MTFDEAMQYMQENTGKAVECKELGITLAYAKPYFNPEEVIKAEGDESEPTRPPEDDRECFCIQQRGQWFRVAPSNSFFRYDWQKVE